MLRGYKWRLIPHVPFNTHSLGSYQKAWIFLSLKHENLLFDVTKLQTQQYDTFNATIDEVETENEILSQWHKEERIFKRGKEIAIDYSTI